MRGQEARRSRPITLLPSLYPIKKGGHDAESLTSHWGSSKTLTVGLCIVTDHAVHQNVYSIRVGTGFSSPHGTNLEDTPAYSRAG